VAVQVLSCLDRGTLEREERSEDVRKHVPLVRVDVCNGPRIVCHAYCDYGLRYPGRYRVLFGTAGTPGWDPQAMPGMATWDLFRTSVRDSLDPATDDTSANQTAICIWAALHGLLTLRRDRPSFPWPGLKPLIDTVLTTHLHAPAPAQALDAGPRQELK